MARKALLCKVIAKGCERIMDRKLPNRKETIKQLQELGFRATPTVGTYDMGLQYDYICHDGAGTGLGNMISWPAYFFRKIDGLKWAIIREKVIDGTLCIDDLQGTDLYEFVNGVLMNSSKAEDESIAGLLCDLKDFPEHFDNVFYCLFDDVSWDCKPEFFASEHEVQERFKDKYCRGLIAWEDMDLEELEDWLSRSQDDLSEFPYNTLHDETEQ